MSSFVEEVPEGQLKINSINDLIDAFPKKGGRKRSKKGGVIHCTWCGRAMEKTGMFAAEPREIENKIHDFCKVQAQGRERDKRKRRREKKRRKSPFRALRIKKPENRQLTPQEEALNTVNEQYEHQWELGQLTPKTIVESVMKLGELYNNTVTQTRELLTTKKKQEEREEEEEKNYASEILAYRCNLLIYYILETAFVAIGMGIGYYSYEQALWTSFCIAEWIEATFPSYMKKKLKLEAERQEADLETRLYRDKRDLLRKIKRDLRRGYNMRNNELPESEVPEILELPDGDEKEGAIDKWIDGMRKQDPERPNRVNNFFGDVMDSVTSFMDKAEDGFYTTTDMFADKFENSRRTLGDGVREVFAPATTLTGAAGAQAEALNAIYPVFYVMGVTLLYFYLFKNMFRHLNPKPNKPKKQGGRKKTRKKRRKTRRKSKKRKSKRRRRKKTRKKRR